MASPVTFSGVNTILRGPPGDERLIDCPAFQQEGIGTIYRFKITDAEFQLIAQRRDVWVQLATARQVPGIIVSGFPLMELQDAQGRIVDLYDPDVDLLLRLTTAEAQVGAERGRAVVAERGLKDLRECLKVVRGKEQRLRRFLLAVPLLGAKEDALEHYWRLTDWLEGRDAALAETTPELPETPAPIDMVLHCPACSVQHIDRPNAIWDNPPHRSHLCDNCGHIWRPADVPTNGVVATKTRGKRDT